MKRMDRKDYAIAIFRRAIVSLVLLSELRRSFQSGLVGLSDIVGLNVREYVMFEEVGEASSKSCLDELHPSKR